MSEIITVGLDLAKNVFQIHGADGRGAAVLRKKLRRAEVLEFFAKLPSCLVAMEACGGVHFWGRELAKLGQTKFSAGRSSFFLWTESLQDFARPRSMAGPASFSSAARQRSET